MQKDKKYSEYIYSYDVLSVLQFVLGNIQKECLITHY